MRTIALLGSTGSIGLSTLDLVRRFPERFKVYGLVAGENLKRLVSQIREFAPRCVAIKNEEDVPRLRKLLGNNRVEVLCGEQGAAAVSTAHEVDIVVAAIVGGAGLMPTLAAVRAGKEVALANKEALVMAGEIFVNAAKQKGVRLLPVDSEHSAIFQCLQGNRREEVDKLILTASGGPFLRTPLKLLNRATVAQALKHPNWKMGRKITIDSATMMNKGLEVVEARWEFDMDPGSDRRRYPSSECGSFNGSISGWSDYRAAWHPRYAHSHRLRFNLSASVERRLEASGIDPAWRVKLFAGGRQALSRVAVSIRRVKRGWNDVSGLERGE